MGLKTKMILAAGKKPAEKSSALCRVSGNLLQNVDAALHPSPFSLVFSLNPEMLSLRWEEEQKK